MAALFIPVLLFLFGVAFPLEWITPPDHDHLLAVVSNPVTVLFLLGLCVMSLFHWAHRFRYTLYDGLQLRSLEAWIGFGCYGGAVVGSLASAYVLLELL